MATAFWHQNVKMICTCFRKTQQKKYVGTKNTYLKKLFKWLPLCLYIFVIETYGQECPISQMVVNCLVRTRTFILIRCLNRKYKSSIELKRRKEEKIISVTTNVEST